MFSVLYGVLHMALNYCHMEYSMRSLFPAVWSASYYCHSSQFWKKFEELHKTCFQCSMEYSIWRFSGAIWSTPCGHYFLPYGVLHIIVIHVNSGINTKSSIRLVFSALWSTPYGLELLSYGVLHMVLLCCHMECFTINSK